MNKDELYREVENIKFDLNYYINSGKGTAEQKTAWKYAREWLDIILVKIKKLD